MPRRDDRGGRADARPRAARRRGRGGRLLRAQRRAGARRLPHPSGVRRRSRRRVLAPRRRRELRGAACRGRRHPLDRHRDACALAGRAARARRAARGVDARARHDDVGGKVRLRARPRHRARVPASRSRGRRLADVARRALGAAGARRMRTRTSTSSWPTSSPRRRRSRTPPTSSSSAGRSTRRRRGATWRRARRRGSRSACTATSSPRAARSPLAIDLGARSIDHLEATGAVGVQELGYSEVVAVLLPASALFLDRPMPPARALADAGAAIALATDFNPGSSFTTSLPLIASLACTQLHLAPEEALVAMTVNAAHVLGAPDRGSARGGDARRRDAARRAGLALPRLPPRGRPRVGGRSRGIDRLPALTWPRDAEQEAAPPPVEGLPSRRPRLRGGRGRERGPDLRAAGAGRPRPRSRSAKPPEGKRPARSRRASTPSRRRGTGRSSAAG